MFIFVAPIIFAVAIFGVIFVNTPSQGEPAKRSARTELTRYRIFVSTADTFFKTASVPSVTSTYLWDDIKSAAPSGYAAATFRADWRAVRSPDGSWAACTPMNEVTVAMINEVYAQAATSPAQAASGTSSMIGNRVLPSALTGGGSGALQLSSPSVSGLVALGKGNDALSAANLCNQ